MTHADMRQKGNNMLVQYVAEKEMIHVDSMDLIHAPMYTSHVMWCETSSNLGIAIFWCKHVCILPCRLEKHKDDHLMEMAVSNSLRQELKALQERHKTDMVRRDPS